MKLDKVVIYYGVKEYPVELDVAIGNGIPEEFDPKSKGEVEDAMFHLCGGHVREATLREYKARPAEDFADFPELAVAYPNGTPAANCWSADGWSVVYTENS